MRYRVWTAVVVSSFGWGTGDVVTRMVLERGAGPYWIAAIRTGVAGVALIIYLLAARRTNLLGRKTSRLGVIQGVAHMAGPYVLVTLALQYASAGFVAIMTALIPMTAAVFAHYMLPDEPLAPSMVVGLGISLVGVAALLASGDSGLAVGGEPLLASVLILIAVLMVGYAAALAKRHAGEYDAMELVGEQAIIATAVLVVLAVLLEGSPGRFGADTIALLGYLGVFTTVVPFGLFFWVLKHASVTLASLSAYLIPLVGVVGGVIVLDEQLQAGVVGGGILILIGSAVADRMDRRREEALVADPPPAI